MIAPLPDMTTCAYCGYLAVGHWRGEGLFVCTACASQEQDEVPADLLPWLRIVADYARRLEAP